MNDDTAWIVVALTLCIAIYGLPSIIAFRRRHPNRWVILAVNGLFGGTLVGWVIELT